MWRSRINRIKNLDFEPARYLNLGLAAWLLISVFMWHHSEPQFLITVVVGAVVAFFAPFELGSSVVPGSPRVRKLNIAAGGALALAAVALPGTSTLTLCNNVLIGLAIAAISFFGPPHGTVPVRPPAPDGAYDGVGM